MAEFYCDLCINLSYCWRNRSKNR